MAFHSTLIIGYVGRDPETRHIGDGKQVCNFSVAVTDKWKGSDGVTQERTTWYKVSAWGALADICQQYVIKGRQVMVKGTCATSAWIDKDGIAKSSLDLTMREFQLLGSKSSHNEEYTPPQASTHGAVDLKDIPF